MFAVRFSALMIWKCYFSSQPCGYTSEMHEGRVYFSESMVQSFNNENNGRQWEETNRHKPHWVGDVIGHVKLKRSILDSHLCFTLHQICASITEGCTSSFQGCNSYLKTFRLFSLFKNRAILYKSMDLLQPPFPSLDLKFLYFVPTSRANVRRLYGFHFQSSV